MRRDQDGRGVSDVGFVDSERWLMRLMYLKVVWEFPGSYSKREALYTFCWCVVGSVPLLGGPSASKDNLLLPLSE